MIVLHRRLSRHATRWPYQHAHRLRLSFDLRELPSGRGDLPVFVPTELSRAEAEAYDRLAAPAKFGKIACTP